MRAVEVSDQRIKVNINYDERQFVSTDDVHALVLEKVVEAMSLIGLPIAIEEPAEEAPAEAPGEVVEEATT